MTDYENNRRKLGMIDELLSEVESLIEGDDKVKGLGWCTITLTEVAENAVFRATIANELLTDQAFYGAVQAAERDFGPQGM